MALVVKLPGLQDSGGSRSTDNTTTFIDINYNPHPCTIDSVLCHVDQERNLHRLGDLIEYLFVHEDNTSERDMFKMIYD
jgi:hypothetical protein